MNRSLPNVLFGGIGAAVNPEAHKIEGTITKTTVDDTVEALSNADSVILVVGYGMAVAKAQYPIAEICSILRSRGITVRVRTHTLSYISFYTNVFCQFAIHPVAGRMPGQCNVLLAEAAVPYDSMCHN